MYVNAEKFNALLEEVSSIRAKLDLYEKFEHAREKEFRELERDVYRLKNERDVQLHTPQVRPNYGQADYEGTAGVAWLR
ncbi:MAG: hypothetical protein WDZ91_02135 [Paenibacillaceae bacterium]